MIAKNIMHCFYNECCESDLVSSIRKDLTFDKNDFLVVIDKNNKYKGIADIVHFFNPKNQSKQVLEFINEIKPIGENDDIRNLKTQNTSVIPVVSDKEHPVGVIELSNLIPLVQRSSRGNSQLKSSKKNNSLAKYTIDNIIGDSNIIFKLKESIMAASRTSSTVLILGETGVGKELVAQSIVNLSNRRYESFIRINCAAIPDNLLESELFGYAEGAFTGAAKGGCDGKFSLADDGTILLDEIGDMPLNMQSKILRVLQEKEIEKIGGKYPIPINVRIIAATHNDISTMVKNNSFRKDLYYRLNVITIKIPPLREHIEDIKLLTDTFIKILSEELGVEKPRIEDGVIDLLKKYSWPGNVRELRNVIEMMISLSNGKIKRNMVFEYISDKEEIKNESSNFLKLNAYEAEKETIQKYLEIHNGDKAVVADILGISKSTLYNKIKKYHMK